MADSKKDNIENFVRRTASLAEANNHLALNLHKLLAKEQQNVFFSPLSISTALAMLHHGARQETADEMRRVLGYDKANLSNNLITASYKQLLDELNADSGIYTLAVANSLLSQVSFSVHNSYKSDLEQVYRALVKEVDFVTNSEAVLGEINEYVKANTRGMIPQLIDSLDPATVIVILNAVYFKGTWSHQFKERDTRPQWFFNKGLKSNGKEVSMMHMRESFLFFQTESYKALELPYRGDIAMMVLLPNALNGLVDLESNLNDGFIRELKKEMFEIKVNVSLPKLHMEYSKSLVKAFQGMGMNKVFHTGANLGGLSNCRELAVSEIIHKAVLDVNEEGSEAAAATAVMMVRCSMPIVEDFQVDHPFMFILYDTRNEFIMFMGRVEEL